MWQAEIKLEGARVPVENRLAHSNGFEYTAKVLTDPRHFVAWEDIGHAVACYEAEHLCLAFSPLPAVPAYRRATPADFPPFFEKPASRPRRARRSFRLRGVLYDVLAQVGARRRGTGQMPVLLAGLRVSGVLVCFSSTIGRVGARRKRREYWRGEVCFEEEVERLRCSGKSTDKIAQTTNVGPAWVEQLTSQWFPEEPELPRGARSGKEP